MRQNQVHKLHVYKRAGQDILLSHFCIFFYFLSRCVFSVVVVVVVIVVIVVVYRAPRAKLIFSLFQPVIAERWWKYGRYSTASSLLDALI